MIYLDTSVIAPLYWTEAMSNTVEQLQRAREWISRFETPLRTLDALHLAIAAENDLCLVTSDAGFAISAETFGIKVQILRPPIEG